MESWSTAGTLAAKNQILTFKKTNSDYGDKEESVEIEIISETGGEIKHFSGGIRHFSVEFHY